ncbi:MAG TPA: pilus assembly protein TadG-related protein [Caulobacteraceae bacterium]|jgi:Flp pilus assembly protein TadG|nr:pilus assembly protein TadG-related protein [Caulobacteraceae bacterium]
MSKFLARLFATDKRGTVAVIFAITAIPLVLMVGVGVDYTSAADRQAQLNAAADAAALAAVTPTAMAGTTAAATTTAKNVFGAQASSIAGVTYAPANVTVNIVTAGLARTVTVSYTVASQNAFSGALGMNSINLVGSATATAGLAPNINFYLLLDSSPSMAIAATQAGINTMVNNTSAQGGCAFACHETNPTSSDVAGNPHGIDNYQLSQNLGVTLRIDNVRAAAQNLMTTAQNTENTNNANYQMAIYTFDTNFNTIQPLTSNLSTAKTAAGNINFLTVYSNSYLSKTNNNNDTDTNYTKAMQSLNTLMPDPGSGTAVSGDTPQEVMFFVTDGVGDEDTNSGSGVTRKISVIDTALCDTIKTRGIRIAVLYTTYLPLPSNSFYVNNIAPFQPNISPTLQNCASPGLFYEVQTGGDISAALSSLFALAVQSAHLSK